jgi:hypothetical protein
MTREVWFVGDENNSKIVVDVIQANHTGVSELSSIIILIKPFLHFNSNFEIKFTKWKANMYSLIFYHFFAPTRQCKFGRFASPVFW